MWYGSAPYFERSPASDMFQAMGVTLAPSGSLLDGAAAEAPGSHAQAIGLHADQTR